MSKQSSDSKKKRQRSRDVVSVCASMFEAEPFAGESAGTKIRSMEKYGFIILTSGRRNHIRLINRPPLN